jgi:GWxTD domain-containing protein
MRFGYKFVFAAVLSCSLTVPCIYSQTTQDAQWTDQKSDPRKRQLSDEQRRKSQKALRQELKGSYKAWLEQDVAYIISDEERKSFMSLGNDEERESFIEQFWLRRNSNPNSPENEFREEHYRRIQYANDHFAAGEPGWKTDRGRIYIMWGPPDNIDAHPSAGLYERPSLEGGGITSSFPFEVWTYRHLEGVGGNINLEFVDTCQCGNYHFTIDRSEKDALKYIPGGGFTDEETRSKKTDQIDKIDRYVHGGWEQLGNGGLSEKNAQNEFDRLQLREKIFSPPPVKFKDLDAFVSEHKVLTGPPLPFDVRTDYVKVTGNMDIVPITIQIRHRDLTYVTKNGVSRASVNILGKVTTIMHKTVQTFEETVEVQPQPAELLEKSSNYRSVFWKALPLRPGQYRLDIAIKDVNNPDHIGIYGKGIEVPSYPDDKLGTSSLILADKMNVVSSREIGTGNFILGNVYVRPSVGSGAAATQINFHRNQDFNFWMQVYNLGIDEATRSNQAKLTYQIVDSASGGVIFEKQVNSKELSPHSDQITLARKLSLAGLTPGKYFIKITVNDAITKQVIAQSVYFTVD